MKTASFIVTRVYGVGALLALAASSPAGASPAARVFNSPSRQATSTVGHDAALRPHRAYAVKVMGCSSNYATPGDYFVGVTDGMNYAYGLDSAVLGGASNEACVTDATIAGGTGNIAGGSESFVGGGYDNATTGLYSTVGSGYDNEASGPLAFVASGWYGLAGGNASFVGAGGTAYYASVPGATPGGGNVADGIDSFVGAGDLNQISSNGYGSFIGAGGYQNANAGLTAGNQITATDAFIGAGDQNFVSGTEAFLGGGDDNTASGQKAVLGGGEANEVAGSFAVVPGGYHDEALGNESFAAGSQAEAKYTGSFVWSDYVSGESVLNDSANDEFVARASGGVYFFSNAGKTSGVHLAAGSGSWASLSDRNAKTDVVPLDDASILSKVAALPISAWRYKTESGVRHVGPMAQDFYAAFGVGEDDRHITSIDEDGVALAAIKALHRENGELRSSLARVNAYERRKQGEIDRLRADVTEERATFERRLEVLEAKLRP